MDVIFESLKHLLDPDWIMNHGGLYLVLIILFIETGLFFGFFLPGDPLLFISGMVIANTENSSVPFESGLLNLVFWMLLFILSTVAGNMVGYWSGYKFSHVFRDKKRKSRLLKPKHIDSAQEFYEKRGGFAILIARFLPIVRTFVPIVGGIVKMNFRHFMVYNVLGAILWVVSITSIGYMLGENKWIQENLEWTILALVLIVTVPVIVKMFIPKKTK